MKEENDSDSDSSEILFGAADVSKIDEESEDIDESEDSDDKQGTDSMSSSLNRQGTSTNGRRRSGRSV